MSTDRILKVYSQPSLSKSVANSGKVTAESGNRAGGFNYADLLSNLREKDEEAESIEKVPEAAPMFNMFDKEYLPGKGMRNGGYGGLIVGRHYQLK